MPKRNSDRNDFGDAFEQNPFTDVEPLDMYRDLQWDKDPEAMWEVNAPEPMVALGELAGVDFGADDLELWDEDEAPFLAVGRDSNMLYVVPKDDHGGPVGDIPAFDPKCPQWRKLGPVSQTDYYSNKGNEAAYYYHTHENPCPVMWEHDSGCRVLIPRKHKGKRSYAVVKEGIVG